MSYGLLYGDQVLQAQSLLSLKHLCKSHFELSLLGLVDADVVQSQLSLVANV